MHSDWTCEADYPPLKGTSMHRWAVEFLKRNEKFNKAVAGIASLAGPKSDPDSPFRKRWREIADEFGIAHAVLKEWKLDSPVIFKVAPYFLVSGVRPSGASSDCHIGVDHGWDAAMMFDLRRPIAPQVRTAEKLLKLYCRSGVKPLSGVQRNRGANYVLMLRTLDARAAVEKWSSLAKTLLPKKDRQSAIDQLKKLHVRAKQLRDGGYALLPALTR